MITTSKDPARVAAIKIKNLVDECERNLLDVSNALAKVRSQLDRTRSLLAVATELDVAHAIRIEIENELHNLAWSELGLVAHVDQLLAQHAILLPDGEDAA